MGGDKFAAQLHSEFPHSSVVHTMLAFSLKVQESGKFWDIGILGLWNSGTLGVGCIKGPPHEARPFLSICQPGKRAWGFTLDSPMAMLFWGPSHCSNLNDCMLPSHYFVANPNKFWSSLRLESSFPCFTYQPGM